ncbi:hypothetical protein [Kineococcus sp. SYSU DK005]|uniref:hypothetical protein n=1 Tax=Kineococcus sp. SYSU DK005 TaxID=3383126 RepID=UPI003D7D947D
MPDSPPEAPAPPRRSVYFVVEYEWEPAAVEVVRRVYPRHRADTDRLGAAGQLWMIGTLSHSDVAVDVDTAENTRTAEDAHPPARAIAVFRDRLAAERFRVEDPLFTRHCATSSPVQRWSALEH